MTVRPFDSSHNPNLQTLQAVLDRRATAPGSRGASFGSAIADAMGRSGIEGKKEVLGQHAAELMQLDMMRSALTLDSNTAGLHQPAIGAPSLAEIMAAYGKSVAAVVPESGDSSPQTVTEATETAPAVPVTDRDLSAVISKASRQHGVDEGLIRAVIQVESNFKPTAVSPAGARGLMQLMPATAAGLGVTDSFDIEQNVMAGTRYLKGLLKRYGGDLDKALSAYNWGPGNLERGGTLPAETRNYLVRVKKLYGQGVVA